MELRDPTLEAIEAHVASEFPNEACGLVLGSLQVIPMKNCAADPIKGFSMDLMEFAKYHSQVEFVYHSHPNRCPAPSKADIESCNAVGVPFLIMSYPAMTLARIVPEDFRKPLKGRPFVYGMYDCFSVVRDYYLEKLSIQLPEVIRPAFGWWDRLSIQSPSDHNPICASYRQAGFVEVGEGLQTHDVVLMATGKHSIINHMGVYTGHAMLTHHMLFGLSRDSSYIGPYGSDYWSAVTKRILRHVSQC